MGEKMKLSLFQRQNRIRWFERCKIVRRRTLRQIYMRTEKQSDEQTDMQIDRRTDRHTDRHRDRQTHRQTQRHTQEDVQMDRHRDTGRRTNTQTHTHTHGQRDTNSPMIAASSRLTAIAPFGSNVYNKKNRSASASNSTDVILPTRIRAFEFLIIVI